MVREKMVMVRLSDEEHAAMTDAARREDVPAAQLVRRALKRELERLKDEHKRGKR